MIVKQIPAGVFRVTENGIPSARDVARLRAAGHGAFLVGEHLMKSGDAKAAIRQLVAA